MCIRDRAQVAVAWLIGRITAPIASATSPAQFQEIAKAPQIKLTADDLAAFDRATAS